MSENNSIWGELYTKASEKEEETPCIKYSVRNDAGVYEKHIFHELEGTFTGAFPFNRKIKNTARGIETEVPMYVFKIAVGGKEHAIQIRHFKPGYDFINLMANVKPNDLINIKLGKYKSTKDGRWWMSLKISRVEGNLLKEVSPKIPWTDYPRASPLLTPGGKHAKGSDGKELYDFTEVTDFWDGFFKQICAKFPRTERRTEAEDNGSVPPPDEYELPF